MIERIYRTETKTEYREELKTKRVKKTIKEPPRYICGRCGKSFQRGDNKRDPEKCPICVCTRCGRSLMDRPSHHKLCGYCWGMGTAGRTYHHSVKQVAGKSRTEWVEENVIEKVPYSVTDNILENPVNIKYQKENSVKKFYVEDLDGFFFDEAKKHKVAKPLDFEWHGDYYENIAYSLLDNKNNIIKLDTSLIKEISPNEEILHEKQILEEFNDVVGFYPNVPAYIQGFPLDMYNNKRTNVRKIVKSFDFVFNITEDSIVSRLQYRNKGLIAFNLINLFVNRNIDINLLICDCSFIPDETVIIEYFRETVNPETFDKKKQMIYNLLTNVSFLRVVSKEYKIELIGKEKISKQWKDGLGYAFQNDELFDLLDLKDNCFLFNYAEGLKINGVNINADYIEYLEKSNLINDNRDNYKPYNDTEIVMEKPKEKAKASKNKTANKSNNRKKPLPNCKTKGLNVVSSNCTVTYLSAFGPVSMYGEKETITIPAAGVPIGDPLIKAFIGKELDDVFSISLKQYKIIKIEKTTNK